MELTLALTFFFFSLCFSTKYAEYFLCFLSKDAFTNTREALKCEKWPSFTFLFLCIHNILISFRCNEFFPCIFLSRDLMELVEILIQVYAADYYTFRIRGKAFREKSRIIFRLLATLLLKTSYPLFCRFRHLF